MTRSDHARSPHPSTARRRNGTLRCARPSAFSSARTTSGSPRGSVYFTRPSGLADHAVRPPHEVDRHPSTTFPDDPLVAVGKWQFQSMNTAKEHDSFGDSRRPDACRATRRASTAPSIPSSTRRCDRVRHGRRRAAGKGGVRQHQRQGEAVHARHVRRRPGREPARTCPNRSGCRRDRRSRFAGRGREGGGDRPGRFAREMVTADGCPWGTGNPCSECGRVVTRPSTPAERAMRPGSLARASP